LSIIDEKSLAKLSGEGDICGDIATSQHTHGRRVVIAFASCAEPDGSIPTPRPRPCGIRRSNPKQLRELPSNDQIFADAMRVRVWFWVKRGCGGDGRSTRRFGDGFAMLAKTPAVLLIFPAAAQRSRSGETGRTRLFTIKVERTASSGGCDDDAGQDATMPS